MAWKWLKKILKGAAAGGLGAAGEAVVDLAQKGQEKAGGKLGGVAGIGIAVAQGAAHEAADAAKKKLEGESDG